MSAWLKEEFCVLHRVNIKPLSTNSAWQGKRYKSPAYRAYVQELSLLLPRTIDVPEGRLAIHFVFGLSKEGADYDNCIKQAQDVICGKYGFNDSRIYRAVIDKVIVPKGGEFIEFEISALPEQRQERAA
jgi:Holliday junction resolvase RusA-like endonuclease